MKKIFFIVLVTLCHTICMAQGSGATPEANIQDSALQQNQVNNGVESRQITEEQLKYFVKQQCTLVIDSVFEEKLIQEFEDEDHTKLFSQKIIKSSWLIWIMIGGMILLFVLVVISLLKSGSPENTENPEDSNRYESNLETINYNIQQLRSKINTLQSELDQLKTSPSNRLEKNDYGLNSYSWPSSPRSDSKKEPQIKYLYLKNHKDGYLKECQENMAHFKLYLNDDELGGNFECIAKLEETLKNKDSVFKDNSILKEWTSNSTDYRTSKKGVAVKEGGNWKVKEKIEVVFS